MQREIKWLCPDRIPAIMSNNKFFFWPNRAFQVNYIIITCFSSLLSLLLLIITSVIILLLLIITSVITSLLPIIITRSIIGNSGSIISYHRPGQLGDEFGQIGLRLCACPLYM